MLHITARMKLLKTEEEGRTSCVRSVAPPNIRFGDLYTDGRWMPASCAKG